MFYYYYYYYYYYYIAYRATARRDFEQIVARTSKVHYMQNRANIVICYRGSCASVSRLKAFSNSPGALAQIEARIGKKCYKADFFTIAQ